MGQRQRKRVRDRGGEKEKRESEIGNRREIQRMGERGGRVAGDSPRPPPEPQFPQLLLGGGGGAERAGR